MLMLAIQLLCNAARFLAAHMGALGRLCRVARRGRVPGFALRVALRRVLMDAGFHKGIAVLGVLMIAGRPLAVAAGFVMNVMRTYNCWLIRIYREAWDNHLASCQT